MNNEQQFEYLKKRLSDLQQYFNREVEMMLDDIKCLERKEEVHKPQREIQYIKEVNDDNWKHLPGVLTHQQIFRRFLVSELIRRTT